MSGYLEKGPTADQRESGVRRGAAPLPGVLYLRCKSFPLPEEKRMRTKGTVETVLEHPARPMKATFEGNQSVDESRTMTATKEARAL